MGVYKYDSTNDELNPIAGSTTYADLAVGSIIPYGGATPPISFLICDGAEVAKEDYPELYSVIGDLFGTATVATNFMLPDLRESVPVGVGKNITKSIANHDRYNLGQFKDDALGTHNHPLVSVTTATFNTAGVPVGIGNNNTPTSATHGKQLGVNYIIKAKMVGVPADFLAEVGEVYQKKDLAQAVEGATTVEGALGALSSNKAAKATTAHTFSFLIGASMQRTVKIPYGAKQLGIDIKSVSQNTRGSEFIANIVGYGTMQDNRAICLYKRLESTAILISDISDDGQYTSFVIGNPFATGDQTVIMTLYNIDRSNVTVESPISNTITAMGSRWQEYITSKEVSYSTSETKTGKTWIDGKPIYRKVFTGLNFGDTTTTWVTIPNATVANVDTLISATVLRKSSSSSDCISTIPIKVTSSAVQYYAHDGFVNCTGLILEYTKTTD